MPAKGKKAKKAPGKIPKPRVSKLNVWFKYYTDDSNPRTYLNKTESTRAAGYRCRNNDSFRQVGCQNFTKLTSKINQWLDEFGLSEAYLKNKLISLVEAKQIVLTKVKGEVDPGSLPPGAMIVAKSSVMSWRGRGEDAEPFDEGDSVVAIPMEALETQRRSLDMAFKIKALYAPEKIDVTDTRMVQSILDALPSEISEKVKASIRAKAGKK